VAGREPRLGKGPRVLHVAHHALPHIGGLEAVVEAETAGLAGRGWRVTLVSSATGTVPGVVQQRHGVRGVRIRAWNGMERRFGVPFPVFSPRLVTALWREVRRADVVHIHDPLYLSSWVAGLWCWVLRRPYVVHRHVGFVHHSSLVVRLVQGLVLATVARLVLERARAVLAIDERIASGVRARLTSPARVRVLGNGVDTACFRPPETGERERLRRALGLPVEEPLVLFVGRFVPKKGFPLVARAAGDRYRIVFVGGKRPAGLDDPRLVFLGALPPERMPEVYRCVDVFVVASVGECPLTVLEALSSGLPVVLNDDPALRSPWTSGPGVRVVDMASGALGPTLDRMLDEPAALCEAGRAGRGFVGARFSWQGHIDELERVYRQVLTPVNRARADP
jgi:glycosyltransferase involved in cell wall biosynthesis